MCSCGSGARSAPSRSKEGNRDADESSIGEDERRDEEEEGKRSDLATPPVACCGALEGRIPPCASAALRPLEGMAGGRKRFFSAPAVEGRQETCPEGCDGISGALPSGSKRMTSMVLGASDDVPALSRTSRWPCPDPARPAASEG
mmetsp:Transcript_92830/g.199093  ORF Transcript_92830/g.199093 Transcript_92830/m.199093 type:complete len:145 (-) Transcript_92830:1898-2332(-)